MPQVSIIIATYNSARTIREALESVCQQTFQDWECIVVDGASTDGTLRILEEFVAKDTRFRYVSEPDKGIYDAFNKGWRMARGEWVHYLGSDDRLTKNSFTDLLKEDLDGVAVVSGSAYIVKVDGSIVLQKSLGWHKGCHQAKLTRRKVLKEMRGFDTSYKVLADAELCVRMDNKGYAIVTVDSPVAYFAMGGISQQMSTFLLLYRERNRIYAQRKDVANPSCRALRTTGQAVLSDIYRRIRKSLRNTLWH